MTKQYQYVLTRKELLILIENEILEKFNDSVEVVDFEHVFSVIDGLATVKIQTKPRQSCSKTEQNQQEQD